MTIPSAMKERILRTIDDQTAARIAFLQELVRIPSPEGEGERIVTHVARRLTDLGADLVDVFRPDPETLRGHPGYSPVHPEHSPTPAGQAPVVVGTFRGTGGGRSLMFYGHLETGTPVWEPAVVNLMRHDPWAAVIEDGKLYGRGAYNMKSGNAAGIMALVCLRQTGIRLQGDVLFNFNTDEDVGSDGALASVIRGYRADGGINPEPSGHWICPTTGGPLWFRVEVTGRSAFAGWALGVNAIDKAIPIYQAIREYADYRKRTARHPMYDRLPNPAPLAVGVLRAGNWPSNIPQLAIIEGRIGCLPGEDLEAVQAEFVARIQAVADGDDWLKANRPRVIWTARWEPCLTPVDHPIVQTAAGVYRNLMGKEPVISGKTAGNDMTKITTYGGVPSINWGPAGGPFGYRHRDTPPPADEPFDEYVVLDSYHDLTALFALTLVEWCGVA